MFGSPQAPDVDRLKKLIASFASKAAFEMTSEYAYVKQLKNKWQN